MDIALAETKWPLGWRAKIGLIFPAHEDGHSPYECRALCPEGVITLETRATPALQVFLPNYQPGVQGNMEGMKVVREACVNAAQLIALAKPDVICYWPPSTTFLGAAGDAALIGEMEEKTGIRATTGSFAIVQAIGSLGLKNILYCTHTKEEVTRLDLAYYGDAGVRIAHHRSFGEEEPNASLKRMSPWELYNLVLKAYRSCAGVDGVVISGGVFRTVEMIEALEKAVEVPVVTTVSANLWHSLQLARIREPIPGAGLLLERPR